VAVRALDPLTRTDLDLLNCGITAAGATHLAEGVGRSASLATLSLPGNKIRDSGAEGLGRALATSSTLTDLDLSQWVWDHGGQ
jgi:hypothetical protein